MQDLLSMARSLRRPALLVRAAACGQDDYDRDTHLPRILGCATAPKSGEALVKLLDAEDEVNARRLTGDAGWSAARHVELLIAIAGEAALLAAAYRPSIVD
ncbi:DUF6477 family protein [Pelagovum pacificum]|uniref:Uncharacterized protein n=1 Tax=Pelagovum pacificum TaxID=2588711 RepID=A0A5C5GB83_9RHOB|nr:DUF6477 family protein [Pelagovum pacificum]QQA44833.1 hypothetical protein I8N54_09785 [Pelagovum pacificum]TNY32062.1 hypothetical protein FHY64_01810 [Pelagovum pacificum]